MAYSADSNIVRVTVDEYSGAFRVEYQRAGELVASFRWCDTQEEVDELIASLT